MPAVLPGPSLGQLFGKKNSPVCRAARCTPTKRPGKALSSSKSAAIRTWQDSVRGYKEGEEKIVIAKMEQALVDHSNEIQDLNEQNEFLKNQIDALNSEKMATNMKNMKKFLSGCLNLHLNHAFSSDSEPKPSNI